MNLRFKHSTLQLQSLKHVLNQKMTQLKDKRAWKTDKNGVAGAVAPARSTSERAEIKAPYQCSAVTRAIAPEKE